MKLAPRELPAAYRNSAGRTRAAIIIGGSRSALPCSVLLLGLTGIGRRPEATV